VTLKNQSLIISVDFGDERIEAISVRMGKNLTDGEWHHLTINHRVNMLHVELDGAEEVRNITGTHQHLYIDPDIHIGGGGPRLSNRQGQLHATAQPIKCHERVTRGLVCNNLDWFLPGLYSSNNFVGCLKEVYFNAKSVLWELFAKRHQVSFHFVNSMQCNGSVERLDAYDLLRRYQFPRHNTMDPLSP